MKIISADYIITCNDTFTILKDHAICFDAKIIKIAPKEALVKKYPQALLLETPKNSVLMPGLINPHVHLEFSANSTQLKYGDFLEWLKSVIAKRDSISEASTNDLISKNLHKMRQSGTTCIGAISSFGTDLQACRDSHLRVVFFNEVLGSRPDAVDALFEDFNHRLKLSEEKASSKFFPAISVHSPYSTHPILAKNALDIARKQGYVVSTHFLESPAEKQWLEDGSGDFYDFFSNFSPYARPLFTAHEYLELFEGTKTLFTHCVQAHTKHFEKMAHMNASITHCPVSNRLLGVGKLNLQEVLDISKAFTIGTDGLSSNISLNMWDEMRAALMMHTDMPLNILAQELLKAATKYGASALDLNCGTLEKDKFADLIVCELPDTIEDEEQLPLQVILHTKNVHTSIIQGEI